MLEPLGTIQARKLVRACESRDLAEVRRLLDASVDVNMADSGDLPLNRAIAVGAEEVVQMLLDRRADPNLKDEKGNVPLALELSTFAQHLPITEMLLRAGAHVNAVDSRGWTPLGSAALEVHVKEIELLLRHRANPRQAQRLDGQWVAASDIIRRHQRGQRDSRDVTKALALLREAERREDASCRGTVRRGAAEAVATLRRGVLALCRPANQLLERCCGWSLLGSPRLGGQRGSRQPRTL